MKGRGAVKQAAVQKAVTKGSSVQKGAAAKKAGKAGKAPKAAKKKACKQRECGPMQVESLTKKDDEKRGVTVMAKAELEDFFESHGCTLDRKTGGTKVFYGMFNKTECTALYLRKKGNVWLDCRFRDYLVDVKGWAGGDDLVFNGSSGGNHTWELVNSNLLADLLSNLEELERAGRKDLDFASRKLRAEAKHSEWPEHILKWVLKGSSA